MLVFPENKTKKKIVNSGHSATNAEFNCVSWPCKTVFSQLDKIWNENLEYQMRAQARNLWFFGSQALSPDVLSQTDTTITRDTVLAKTTKIKYQ